ncbi:hypothetical protein VTN96DRAFT_9688 [Rasamsonia emersonii]
MVAHYRFNFVSPIFLISIRNTACCIFVPERNNSRFPVRISPLCLRILYSDLFFVATIQLRNTSAGYNILVDSRYRSNQTSPHPRRALQVVVLPVTMSFSQQQYYAIEAAERACSVLSLVGTFVVISTFIGSPTFRKPINRLVFYASWGNIMSNVATLISRSGILHGVNTPLCQFQGFLIQWFMPADALWTFAMAFNVYLTFFYKYDASRLRRLEWKYVLLCYGLPFIPSFVYFFVKNETNGPIYGSAVLWCWVSMPWDFLRIAVFYGPVWFVILVTFSIYIRAGKEIFKKRRQLQNISSVDPGTAIDNPFEAQGSKITEIHITSEAAQTAPIDPDKISSDDKGGQRGSATHLYASYSVTVESGDGYDGNTIPMKKVERSPGAGATHPRRPAKAEANAAAWAYCKYAMLYFVALLVTWVPSTVNRVYSLAYPDINNFGLEFTSAIVLPLQGFWNSIIYCAISWSSIKQLFRRDRKPRTYKISKPLEFSRGGGGPSARVGSSLHSNESTRELAMHPQIDTDST